MGEEGGRGGEVGVMMMDEEMDLGALWCAGECSRWAIGAWRRGGNERDASKSEPPASSSFLSHFFYWRRFESSCYL